MVTKQAVFLLFLFDLWVLRLIWQFLDMGFCGLVDVGFVWLL
jgi:hypothetical protein